MRHSEAQHIIDDLWQQIEQRCRAGDEVDADKHPERYRLSRTIARGKPASYRYWPAGTDDEGRKVGFGWTVWKNIGDRYLGFREVWDPNKGEGFRDRWTEHKTRKQARGWAEGAVANFQRERQPRAAVEGLRRQPRGATV